MSDMSLPQGWKLASIQEFCEKITDGSHNPPKARGAGLPMLSAKNIFGGRVHFTGYRFIASDEFETEDKRTRITAGDVLITTVATLGRTAVVSESCEKFTLQRSVSVLSSKDIDSRYLKHALDNPEIQQFIAMNAKGNAQKGFYIKQLKELEVKLAPQNEQIRIANKLDELLAQVSAIKFRIDTIPKVMKRFRQSVLTDAVSGKLTKGWRAKNTKNLNLDDFFKEVFSDRDNLLKEKKIRKNFGQYKKAKPLFDNAPSSWAWVDFEAISANENNALKAGPFGSALKKSDCVDSGYRVYGQEQAISGDETLVTYYINEEKFQQLKSCKVTAGDILISLVGTIGKVLILSANAEKGIINPRLVKLSLQKKVNRKYIKIYIDSPYSHDYFRSFSHGGTMEILNLGILKGLPICFPPFDEQEQIVQRVEQLFAFADQIEQRVKDAQTRIDNLTQSILAKAFRGELVPQDPNDEPAVTLLERIKAERAEVENLAKAAKKPARRRAKVS